MAGSHLLVVLAATAAVTAGCGLFDDPVQEEWESRDAYPSCGHLDLEQGEDVEDAGAAEIDCMRDARAAGEGAELAVTYPTIEGDPIHTYYRLNPDGFVVLYEDSTDDPNGAEEWTRVECYEPEWLPEPPNVISICHAQ